MANQRTPYFPVSISAAHPSPAHQPLARMECGVCWYVYDAALGDDVWQIPPGTPFADLPEHWRCPECDAEKHKFMPLDSMEEAAPATGLGSVEALIAAYRRVDQERMQDLPFRNAALGVEAVGFRAWQGGAIGVVITPWFMNLVLLPGTTTDWSAHKHGDLVTHVLPSGAYAFVHGDLEGFGPLQSCSLQSPVPEFQSMDAARATAQEVMRLIFTAPEGEDEPEGPALKPAVEETPEAPAKPRGAISRREFLRGGAPSTPSEN